MGVGAGLSMYVVVVQKFTFAISSPDEFLLSLTHRKFMLHGKFKKYSEMERERDRKETNVKRGWWGMHPVNLHVLPCRDFIRFAANTACVVGLSCP